MKMCINSTPNKKRKLVVLIRKKLTLAYVWYERVWRANNTQFLRAVDMKFVGVHMTCIFRVHMIRIYPTILILPTTQHTHAKVNFINTMSFYLADFHEIVLHWSWAVQLSAVLQKNPPTPAHSLVFQHLLHIWSLSKSECMILSSIFSNWEQLRDSYTTITKGENMYWCSKRQHNALKAGGCKLLNRIMMCKLC